MAPRFKDKRQVAECVYCGRKRETTREHVFGRGFFPKDRRPSNPVIVPACAECNGAKSGDDSYVRDLFSFDIAAGQSSIARANIDGPIARSIKYGRSQLTKEAMVHGRMMPVHTHGGIYIGHAFTTPVNEKRLNRWAECVARGLYWAQNGHKRIPKNYRFKLTRIEDQYKQEMLDDLLAHGAGGPYRMGSEKEQTVDVISWVCLMDRNNNFWSLWLMWFYSSVMILIESVAPDMRTRVVYPEQSR